MWCFVEIFKTVPLLFFKKSYTLTLDCQLNASTPLYKTREVSEGRRGMNGGFIAPQFMLCGHGVSCTNRSQCCFILRCILLQFSTLSCWFVFVFKSLFFRTLPLAPSGGDRWFYADRKMRVSEYKGSLLALLNENILFKVPKTSAYGRFLNAKRS